jgi:tetratricopeptide (TPR) repeat protein
LDSELAAWNLDQSGTTWPLAPWAGRRDPVWHLSRSSQAGLQGDVAAGLETTRRAIECRPYHAPYHLLLAQRLEATGHAEEAAQEVREALRLEPNYGQALVWQIERAPNMEKGALLERLRQAQKLRVTFEEPDPYSLGIQHVDPKWLSEKLRN